MADFLSDAPLPLEDVFSEPRDDCGATVAFVGTVRNNFEEQSVDGLSYSAHRPSAEAQLKAICEEAKERFDIAELKILHRLGDLQLGDSAVLLVCRAGHREGAFDAARWALETMKQRVPIFKKEHYSDGHSDWRDGHSLAGKPDDDDR